MDTPNAPFIAPSQATDILRSEDERHAQLVQGSVDPFQVGPKRCSTFCWGCGFIGSCSMICDYVYYHDHHYYYYL